MSTDPIKAAIPLWYAQMAWAKELIMGVSGCSALPYGPYRELINDEDRMKQAIEAALIGHA